MVATDATLLVGATSDPGRPPRAGSGSRPPWSPSTRTRDVGLVRIARHAAGGPVRRLERGPAGDRRGRDGGRRHAVGPARLGVVGRDHRLDRRAGRVGPGRRHGERRGDARPRACTPTARCSWSDDGAVVGLLDRSGVLVRHRAGGVLARRVRLQVAQELMVDGGQILHGWLGIKGADTESDTAEGRGRHRRRPGRAVQGPPARPAT